MSELALVKSCIEGDQRAQRELFEMYAPKMMGVCLRYTKDVAQAEDVMQEGFIKVFTKLEKYSGQGSLEGWVRRVMVNAALDHLRRESKFNANIPMDDVDYKVEFDGQILESLMEKDLLKLIREMPDGYRTVFNMFAIEGYTHKEIAKQLDISENTSKSQYSRAKTFLRSKIEGLEIGR
ncbi:MAG: sigma-70 family RNA polymerase sigma factor [Crocinitomicaceae bacterium]|nr:sigma-70 family RNA polymerase sigma factor [Crocinitomicaceae bacterium]MDG1657604.1 sigma-70 family RNA polymerase sigma factor [Crocinitomicaceae bacterium]